MAILILPVVDSAPSDSRIGPRDPFQAARPSGRRATPRPAVRPAEAKSDSAIVGLLLAAYGLALLGYAASCLLVFWRR
jgi:hypothetical protein